MDYETALEIAKNAHKGQKRKDGTDYITHPLAVAEKFTDNDFKVVAILHDVLEDTSITIDVLIDSDLTQKQGDALVAITRTLYEPYTLYIMRLEHNHMARTIKKEDLKHNLSTLSKNDTKYKRYMDALKYLELQKTIR